MTGAAPVRAAGGRRARTRRRLIEAATLVLARQGVAGTVIDHVIAQAGVSRGTFYNYFRSVDDLLEAAKDELGAEMVTLVRGAVPADAPLGESVARGIKTFIDVAARYPLYLEFMARLGVRGFGADSFLREVTAAFPRLGAAPPEGATGARALPPVMAVDILEASTIALLRRMRAGAPVDIRAFTAAMLRALGLDPAEAERCASLRSVPVKVPEGSLIARSDAARAG